MAKYLRISLKLGAVYDAALGLLIVLVGRSIMERLGATPDPFLFYLAALPLLILAVMYWSASEALDVDAFRAPVFWARGFGGAFVLALVALHNPPQAWIYMLIGLLDWVWLGIHALLWRRP